MRTMGEVIQMAIKLYEASITVKSDTACFEARAAMDAIMWMREEQDYITIDKQQVKGGSHETESA